MTESDAISFRLDNIEMGLLPEFLSHVHQWHLIQWKIAVNASGILTTNHVLRRRFRTVLVRHGI